MAKKKSKKWLWISIILILIVVAIVFSIFSNKSDDAIEVKLGNVEKRTIVQTVAAVGKLKPDLEVKISSEISGELILLNVKEGDKIKANQVLAKVKPDIIESQLEQFSAAAEASKTEIDFSKSNLERTRLEFERVTDLYGKQFASKQELDIATANFQQAKANLEAAQSRYKQALASYSQIKRNADRTTIYAPIEGTVTTLSVELGEKILGTQQFQGTDMMKVANLQNMNAVVDVNENDIVNVNKGDTAWIEVDALQGKKFKGIVKEIGHSAKLTAAGGQDEVTNFEVKIKLIELDEKIRPGMNCSVEIITETRENVLATPLQSVTIRAESLGQQPKNNTYIQLEDKTNTNKALVKSVVFKVEKGIAKMINVETGISDRGFIEITSGLSENDSIVIGSFSAVSKLLNDGSKIKTAESKMPKSKTGEKK